jgi:hypothetical protein
MKKIAMFLTVLLATVFSFAEDRYVPNEISSLDEIKIAESNFIDLTMIGSRDIEKIFSTSKPDIFVIKIDENSIQRIGEQYLTYFKDYGLVSVGTLIDFTSQPQTQFGKQIIFSENNVALQNYLDNDSPNVVETIDYPATVDEKAVIYVFTDTSCPYCERYFNEVEIFNLSGVTVKHIYYPRAYNPQLSFEEQNSAFKNMADIACSDNPTELLANHFKNSSLTKENINKENLEKCQQQLVDGYTLGSLVGVTGTPATLLPSGELLPGARNAYNLIPYIIQSSPNR